ncbi:carbonic anhydrase [Paenibacillus faecalis]|uniref:carbonic anhydrase n=1 Tax=Paenibacillus faecalis TaxID=2079532 RepID=UPI000D110680|nr:carbonic anhydrase family protein [Paenibacillus faecalis]
MKLKLVLGKALLIAAALSVLTVGTPYMAADSSKTEWSYEGATGPEHWGDLSPEYAKCSTGLNQSPVPLMNQGKKTDSKMTFHYEAFVPTIVNNGHTIQVDVPEGNYALIDGEKYNLLQFHFHTPSEHTYNGKLLEMEIHLVHQNEQGNLAVIGMFIKEGSANKSLDLIFNNLPASQEEPVTTDEKITLNSLFHKKSKFITYDGSLTTPPCTEGVTWYVFDKPVKLTRTQIDAFKDIFPNNSRPVQPLNDRLLYKGTLKTH